MKERGLSVVAQLDIPNYAAEHRYLTMELALARREMQKRPSWLPFSYPGLGILRRSDWQRYIHELEKYGRELDRSEREVHEGLLPLVFMVANDYDRPVQNLKVKLAVKDGQIHAKHKPPVRPRRVDGAPNQSSTGRLKQSWGFSRSGIRITSHTVEAELSRLEAFDNARLVSDALYIDARQGARLHFEIVAKNATGHGEVHLPMRPAS